MEPIEADAGKATPHPGSGWVPPTTLPTHGLTRYLRVQVEVTDGLLRWEVPRTLLGVVPVGVRRLTLPAGKVRQARVRWTVHPLHLLLGVAGIVVPLVLALWWVAGPAVIVGLWVVVASFGPHLEVETLAGKKHRAGVCVGHRFDAELYAAAVNDLAGSTHPGPSA